MAEADRRSTSQSGEESASKRRKVEKTSDVELVASDEHPCVAAGEEADMKVEMKRESVVAAGPEEELDEGDWITCFERRRDGVLQDFSRADMLEALFESWDREGHGLLSFEDILPHYMKCARHHNMLEPEVREAFEKFMESMGKQLKDGITQDLFNLWLSPLSDEQVAAHYVRHVQGWSRHPYKMNIGNCVVHEYKHKALREILDAPPHALWGLSTLAEGALAPLGIHTVRELGSWRCFLVARAICTLAVKEIPDKKWHNIGQFDGKEPMNIRNALLEDHAGATLRHVTHLPVSALSMFPEAGLAALELLHIRTIQHLGRRKYFHWAAAMVELERYETECWEALRNIKGITEDEGTGAAVADVDDMGGVAAAGEGAPADAD
eukprot:TRINITY_DN14214_c0_g1_i1.p1 TRINITY_DN14214_c0_g1~~TRINITY_DN14214_c0_g1_i1.p1  ORF type:complete len:381 (-),score=105.55 TRINITY_DN14214_c0_g1_i1:220-1362(-)